MAPQEMEPYRLSGDGPPDFVLGSLCSAQHLRALPERGQCAVMLRCVGLALRL